MKITPKILPAMIDAVVHVIDDNAEEVTALDQAIGDGDHVSNLQRGLAELQKQDEGLIDLDWSDAFKKIGMILMSTIGGASGSLYGTFFLAMHKAAKLPGTSFAEVFAAGVESVKQRGKADVGEKTMLDVYIPVAQELKENMQQGLEQELMLKNLSAVAWQGMQATKDMQATKGRASFLGERSIGHIDAGAKTAQLMIDAVVAVLSDG